MMELSLNELEYYSRAHPTYKYLRKYAIVHRGAPGDTIVTLQGSVEGSSWVDVEVLQGKEEYDRIMAIRTQKEMEDTEGGDDRHVYELAAALLLLARWYEGDTGSIEPLDKVRAYLKTFPTGMRILNEEEENTIKSEILPYDTTQE